ncbi:hypothetical protein Elgi_49820 [Paenibacillus elgii]|uniref:ACT domain-containing protein n=1 Tax=Paenibacillus elgii TaxID=189691 RepID=UPI002D7D526E|nr:hypothetical protein Elgi_49820 [Paenibacillus elgii]
MEQGIVVQGIAYDKNIAKINILGVPEKPDQLAKVFTALAKEQINVDIITKGMVFDGVADFSFTTALIDFDKALTVIDSIQADLGYRQATHEIELVKVSIVGVGILSTSGVAAKIFEVISSQGVSIKLVSTSEIKMSFVIKLEHLADVARALNTAYGLGTCDVSFVGGLQGW